MLGNLFSTFRPNGGGQGFSPFGMMRGMTPQPPEQDKRPSYLPLNPNHLYEDIFMDGSRACSLRYCGVCFGCGAQSRQSDRVFDV